MGTDTGTITFGRLFGVPIRTTATFLYVAGVLALFAVLGDPSRGVGQVALLLLLLASLVLHELGHALVARAHGIRVLDITLWHLGGMARMSDIPESPRVEAAVASAGPVVNLVLAGLAAPLLLLGPALGPFGLELVTGFVGMNLLLGLLNLLPAFPMDGGRILRAALAARGSWLRATETAARVGRWMAVLMVVVATARFGALGLVLSLLVAGFVWFAGTKELVAVRLRHTGSPFGAGTFARAFGGANPFTGTSGPFGGGAFDGGPFDRDGRGGPREADSRETAAGAAASGTERAPEAGAGARRPTVDGDPLRGARESHGFGDDVVRRLESFHGPLRRRAE